MQWFKYTERLSIAQTVHYLPCSLGLGELLKMYSCLLLPLLLFTCLSLCSYALGTSCISLLTNEFTNKTSISKIAVTFSNSNLKVLQNSTTCFPHQSRNDVEEYISWYSRATEIIKEYSDANSTRHSHLFFGVSSSLANYQRDHRDSFVIPSIVGDTKRMASALLAFVNYNKWRRVAFITHLTLKLYLEPIELFYMNFITELKIHLSQIIGGEKEIDLSLKRIKKLKYRVIIISLPGETLRVLLCRTIGLGMTWPNYIWVIVNSDGSRFYEQNLCLDQELTVIHTLTNKLSTARHEALDDNTNNTNYSTLCNSRGKYTCRICISTWKDNRLKLIANYTPADGLSSVNMPSFPGDIVLTSLFPFYIINSIIALLMFTLLTVMLVLYIWFRNEPDIKATGVSLNILTFLGCFLLSFFLILLNIMGLPNDYTESLHFANHVCKIKLWLNGLSIPGALILSVLLVKLARVYWLFDYRHIIKKWQCHDLTLALYVLFLTAPVILCVLVQSVADDFKNRLVFTKNNGGEVAFYDCQSDSEFYWLIAKLLYFNGLNLVLVILAIKTRKINHPNFKDTKKVIALVFANVVTTCWTLVYYIVLQTINALPIYSYFLLSISHTLIICECQFFLFAPKIFPVLRRRLAGMELRPEIVIYL